MDRSWINFLRTTNEYENGVEEFLEFANMNVPDNNGKFYCPCVNCLNERKLPTDIIREHVLCDGFLKSYTKWIWHGELIDMPSVDVSEAEEVDLEMDDRMEEMIRDIGHDSFQRANVYDNLCNDAEKPLYAECTKYTRLSAVLKLFNVKARNGWTDKSFTELLELLSDMLPKGNTLPTRNYDARRYCVRWEGVSHVTSMSTMWGVTIQTKTYNANDAKLMRWHADGRITDGHLRHLADGLQWKKIDSMFPNFSNDSRNIRFGLATDGMNPYVDIALRVTKHALYVKKAHVTINYNMEGKQYLGHRRFLSTNHPYRKLKKAFNGCQENELAPMVLSGSQVYERVKDIGDVFGKMKNKGTSSNIWKKKSIFFDLPYWRVLDVRHCIDVMHVEKNVCDSIIGTLLNIQGKTKDGLNARLDLVEMGIREQLAPQSHGKRTYLPPACHTLSKQEKEVFVRFYKV
ncbi:uncharacterized protein LOC114180495 [Vigna unguiculata]|uniref:uncharacterized protein LOC114180495 n=1 Tax=Vigna unguiculata TaxID=3917 RepID=UPI0010164269|nr:uncharacterized protein LOC114180495 [Vigna unguiculata]